MRHNRGAGAGRSDIAMEYGAHRRAVIFETKAVSACEDPDKARGGALSQMDSGACARPFLARCRAVCLCGVAFCGKECPAKGKIAW